MDKSTREETKAERLAKTILKPRLKIFCQHFWSSSYFTFEYQFYTKLQTYIEKAVLSAKLEMKQTISSKKQIKSR